MKPAPVALDFVDLEHGLEVLREAVALSDADHVGQCLRLLLRFTEGAKGTAADHLRGTAHYLSDEPADVSPADVDDLSAALADLARDYATAHETEQVRARQRSVDSGRKGGKKRKLAVRARHEEWVAEAKRIRRRNPHKTCAEIGRELARGVGFSADAISRVLRKHLNQPSAERKR